jgi:transcription elongation factor Elf1
MAAPGDLTRNELRNRPRLPSYISCPGCNQGIRLSSFEITYHFDGTWSATETVECPHECGARFRVSHSMAAPVAQSDLARIFPPKFSVARQAR